MSSAIRFISSSSSNSHSSPSTRLAPYSKRRPSKSAVAATTALRYYPSPRSSSNGSGCEDTIRDDNNLDDIIVKLPPARSLSPLLRKDLSLEPSVIGDLNPKNAGSGTDISMLFDSLLATPLTLPVISQSNIDLGALIGVVDPVNTLSSINNSTAGISVASNDIYTPYSVFPVSPLSTGNGFFDEECQFTDTFVPNYATALKSHHTRGGSLSDIMTLSPASLNISNVCTVGISARDDPMLSGFGSDLFLPGFHDQLMKPTTGCGIDKRRLTTPTTFNDFDDSDFEDLRRSSSPRRPTTPSHSRSNSLPALPTIIASPNSTCLSQLDLVEQKRQTHLQSEQRRRAQLRDGFDQLKAELPNGFQNKKMTKAELLTKVTSYVRQLKQRHEIMTTEMVRMREEMVQMKRELGRK